MRRLLLFLLLLKIVTTFAETDTTINACGPNESLQKVRCNCCSEPKCSDGDVAQPCCSMLCEGADTCQCNPGYLRDKDNSCVEKEDCKAQTSVAVCHMNQDPGTCEEGLTRYFYSMASRKCEFFQYGGCAGNRNNFQTQQQCESVCNQEAICSLPSITGNCRAAIKRFAYKPDTATCEEFIFGGCDGNANRFETKEQCMQTCTPSKKGPVTVAVCHVDSEVGPCKASLPKFFFNMTSHTCDGFLYGGCEGNENNFETKDQCLNVCNQKDICSLSAEPGSCRGAFKKYFFQSTSNTCKEFVYGGCHGNTNRFDTQDDCMQTCTAVELKQSKRLLVNPPAMEATSQSETGANSGAQAFKELGFVMALMIACAIHQQW